MKKPDAILCADLQINENQPISRIDNFWETQSRKLKFIYDLQQEYGCPIFDSGDLFETWRCSHALVSWCIENLPEGIITVAGNHDLPSLSLDKFDKSPLNVLKTSEKIQLIDYMKCAYRTTYSSYRVRIIGFPWSTKPKNELPPLRKFKTIGDIRNIGKRNVALCHYMVYENEMNYEDTESEQGINLLKRMDKFDLIVTGHNHKSFVVKHEGRLLINPGSIMRSHADQYDHIPKVFLWYADTNTVEAVEIPIDPPEKVLTRIHIEKKEAKDDMNFSFVNKLNTDYEISISFKKNMDKYFNNNRTRIPVKNIIREEMDRI